ncbi:hypothetical protein STVA_08450 [Allostella vacuolata]|nr:hypothetical protein STVA_08450 [Stella vacuolata]
MQALDPPVGGIEAPFDEAGRLQPVDHASERDRLHLQDVGEPALMDALVARQMGQDRPLRPAETEGTRPPVEPLAQQSRDIVQQEAEMPLEFGIQPFLP